jgi:Peptidase U49
MRILDTQEQREHALAESPICPLVRQFLGSAFSLAPENEANLIQIRDVLNLTIVPIINETGFTLEVVPEESKIFVGIRTIERIWAFSYCYAHMLLQAQAKEQHSPLATGIIVSRPTEVVDLLFWAHKSATNDSLPWPHRSPKPESPTTDGTIKLANECFIGASGWMLFHELGHVLQKHSAYRLIETEANKLFNHGLEFGADKFAFDYILTDWKKYSDDTLVFVKRALLIGVALTILAADAAFAGGTLESHTHPSPLDRVEAFLDYLDSNFADMNLQNQQIAGSIANIIFSIVQLLWPIDSGIIPLRYETPREVITAAKRVFVPGIL